MPPELTVAIAVLLLLHVPLVVASLNVSLRLLQKERGPAIGAGVGFTDISIVKSQISDEE